MIPTLFATLETYSERFGPDHPRTLAIVHELAMALWQTGDMNRAVGLLDRTLDRLTSSFGVDHPARVDVLHTLGEIMFGQGQLEPAAAIFREVLECDIRHAGPNHPSSLEAKADLAAVLFELGHEAEADSLEQEACDDARRHLGLDHSVTTFLVWNRALTFERRGDLASARMLFTNELAWLLTQDPAGLAPGQNSIRTMLAERLRSDTAPVC
jgi:tetratricopeptide (TPR) repeat protein